MKVTDGSSPTPAVPASLYRFADDRGKVYGCLAVDRVVRGLYGGGVRLTPALAPSELAALARTMTWKYAYLGFPIGGAKAAIVCPEQAAAAERQGKIQAFAREIGPLTGHYLPGKDMGMSDAEYRWLMNCLGRPAGDAVDSAFHTAVSVMLAMEELLARYGRPSYERSMIIDGYGKVGRWVARLAAAGGWKVVAIAERDAVWYDPGGLAIPAPAPRRRSGTAAGEENGLPGGSLPRNALYRLPATFFVPCAGAGTVGVGEAEELRVAFVAGGANNPLTALAPAVLARRGIVYFPDFAANCGGVAGAMLESLCRNRSRAAGILVRELRRKFRQLLAAAPDPMTIEETALKMAADVLAVYTRGGAGGGEVFFRPLLSWYRRGWFPPRLEALLGPLFLCVAMRGFLRSP